MNQDEDILVVAYVTVSKILLPDGGMTLEIEQNEDCETWDAIGMLQVAIDSLRDEALYQVGGYLHLEEDDHLD